MDPERQSPGPLEYVHHGCSPWSCVKLFPSTIICARQKAVCSDQWIGTPANPLFRVLCERVGTTDDATHRLLDPPGVSIGERPESSPHHPTEYCFPFRNSFSEY
jgi:hypothetical protein